MASCSHGTPRSGVLCPECGSLTEGALVLGPFELLGLEPRVPVEPAALRSAHLKLAREAHPDFNTQENALAVRISAHVNRCRQALADRLGALRELCRLKAPDLKEPEVGADFLADVMEDCESPDAAALLSSRLDGLLSRAEALTAESRWTEALGHMAQAGYCRSLASRSLETRP